MSDGAHCSHDGILSGWEDNGPTQRTLLQTPHHPRGDCIDHGVCEGLIGTPVPGQCQGQDSKRCEGALVLQHLKNSELQGPESFHPLHWRQEKTDFCVHPPPLPSFSFSREDAHVAF